MTGLIILVIIIVIALLFLTSCIKIVPQAKALVIERLGAYQATWSVGLHFKLPIIERVARRVDLKEQVVDFCLLYTSTSPRDYAASRLPSSA